ncbi:MAG: hypothetical protein HY268_09230 [Deltaproteobacteria bacterium]|nr:hypothetical protein [Deltaproteobacteria bacterium]
MNKQPISITLDPDNLLWLRTRVLSSGCRSVSEVLNRLIQEARAPERQQGQTIRSVVGTIRITEADSDFLTADEAVRTLFPQASKDRPGFSAGKGAKKTNRPSTRRERKHG